jgi:hypothetical protein
MVTVEIAPPGVGVWGFVPVTLHPGSGEPVPVTVQLKVTGELYPLNEVKVTVEVLEAPADTAAGAVAVREKAGCAYLTTKASLPPALALPPA